jgi:hypothetical protein
LIVAGEVKRGKGGFAENSGFGLGALKPATNQSDLIDEGGSKDTKLATKWD